MPPMRAQRRNQWLQSDPTAEDHWKFSLNIAKYFVILGYRCIAQHHQPESTFTDPRQPTTVLTPTCWGEASAARSRARRKRRVTALAPLPPRTLATGRGFELYVTGAM